MCDIFEKLKKIAADEFGCTLIQGEQKRTFRDVFGFSTEDIVDFDGFTDLEDMEISMNILVPQLENFLLDQYEIDSAASASVSLAA